MRWWLDRGVDGFRMDVINFISKVQSFPDGPVVLPPWGGDGSAFYTAGGPRNHEFLQEMYREVFADRPERLLTVGEMLGATVEQAVLFTDQERRELDMVFHFEHVMLDQGDHKWDVRPLRLAELKESVDRWQRGSRGTRLEQSVLEQSRSTAGGIAIRRRALPRSVRQALAAVLHLQRGTPYLYQGEELGMVNARFASVDEMRDIESINYYHYALSAGDDPEG